MKLNFDYKLSRLGLLLLAMLIGQTAYSQRTISGVVTDAESGEPLIGANILIIGAASGTTTGIDGDYSVNVPEAATQLEFSYTGYSSQLVDIDGRSTINVALAPGELLDEVVVIGYGTTTKKDKTGAVNSVSEESFNRGALTSPDQLIAGKVAGVQITTNSGEPGGQTTIRVRGGTSINAGNEPLYVIDGVIIDNTPWNPGGFSGGRNPLNAINPTDIESISVLKDASATAIYGSRGANGVVIITTKKGSAGQSSRVSYDGNVVFSQVAATPDILSPEQFRAAVQEIVPDKVDELGDANTVWLDEVLQNGFGQNHSLSFSGGKDRLGYRVSAGYQNLEGVIRSSRTERTSVAFSLNNSFFQDESLRMEINYKGALTNDQFNDGGALGNALTFDPTQPIFDEDSEFGGYNEYESSIAPKNPVALTDLVEDFGRNIRSIGNIKLDYDFWFLDGLTGSLNLGVDAQNGDRRLFQPGILCQAFEDNGLLREEQFYRMNPLLEFLVGYKRELGGSSRIDAILGYSYQDYFSRFNGITAREFSSNLLGSNSVAPADMLDGFISTQRNNLISYFGRVNYSLMDRYLFTATVRRDGSSRFGGINRWGIFPSGAFKWRLIDEAFMDGARGLLSDLSLRLSYGITGNQEIGNYLFLPTYTFSNNMAQYQFGDDFVTTIRSNGADPNIKWEETASYNIGLDFGFSNGRIAGSVELYRKDTEDLLFEAGVPAGTIPINRVLTNIGAVRNTGFELTLDAFVINSGDISWNLGANFSMNDNVIVALDGEDDPDFVGYPTGGIAGGVGNNIQILRVGEEVNSYFVFQHLLGPDGMPLVDEVDHNEDGVINLADIYADLNEDGVVNDEDKRPFLSPNPRFLYGLTSNFNAYGFDLSFTLRGSAGNYVYNNVASATGNYSRIVSDITLANMETSVLETGFQEPLLFSDYYLENAAFVRLDNITLGYSFDQLFKNGTGLRLYVTGQNLFVFTGYSGSDPEVFNGIDNNIYPRARTFLLGASLTL